MAPKNHDPNARGDELSAAVTAAVLDTRMDGVEQRMDTLEHNQSAIFERLNTISMQISRGYGIAMGIGIMIGLMMKTDWLWKFLLGAK